MAMLWESYIMNFPKCGLGCLAVPETNPARSEGSATMEVYWVRVEGMIL